MQKIAIIDVGSNSARLVITQLYRSGANNMVYNQKEALRLSQKLDKDGNLTEEAFAVTLDCMHSFASMCHLFNAHRIIAVATAAIRNAPNGKKLVAAVKKETGINLEIISGKTEAHMSYLGVINTIDVKDAIIFDLGGGSTELVLVKNRKMVQSISLPIGCVNLTSQLDIKNKMTPSTTTKLKKIIAAQVSKAPWLKGCGLPMIGVGGTARSVGKIDQKRIKYYTPKIHNYQFAIQDFKNTFKYMQGTTLAERKQIAGLSADRADIIVAGSAIIKALADTSKAKKLIISGCGLREGLFMEYITRNTTLPLIVKDILLSSTERALTLYGPDVEHSHAVAKFALTMFDAWFPLHKLNASWRRLLNTSALLHDIGININYYSHARHSGYMIENSRIFGVTHMELVHAAIMAAWHNGVSRGYMRNKQYRDLLTETDLASLGKGALLIALAEALDYSQTQAVHSIKASIGTKGALLTLTAPVLPTIELRQLNQVTKWFKKTFGVPLIIKTRK